ncbi:MAG TPA: short-chain dehydrogenase/reductase [Burkholderiales bacterium]|nr:short-chain dehydrogenase/reductase [Burkholderiales bacterium]
MDLLLKGKRALVTGGSKGIGRACAQVLTEEGCEVLVAARNPAPGANALAIDLSQRGAAESLAAWAGDLDILVNNAGAIPGGDLLKVEEETWRRAWDLKVFGYINLTRQVYARMKSRGRGAIVNIIGTAGEKMNAAYIAGSSANASLMAFTRALGGASHADGIRVAGINPGPVATDRLVSLYRQMAETQLGDPSRYAELFKGMSFGRPAKPEEIAWTAAFLASERSSYTSGCIVTIDGGAANR